jgi:hypothetical protein
MGHSRLGRLPDTAQWRHVVRLLAEDADVAVVANATAEAAERGLRLSKDDPGLGRALWLLARMALAAKTTDFVGALERLKLDVGASPTVFDLAAAYSEALQAHLDQSGRTDIGEMAQLAGVEALVSICGAEAEGLYGKDVESTQAALKRASQRGGFGHLVEQFFSRFTERFLGYHLSRELSCHVGGNGRFAAPVEHTDFLHAIRLHCDQTSVIVRTFAGDWIGKTEHERGITLETAQGFVAHALTKISDELHLRSRRDDT